MNSNRSTHIIVIVFILGLIHAAAATDEILLHSMKIPDTSEPGKVIQTTLKIENRATESVGIAVKTIDLAKNTTEDRWVPLDPNIQDANMADLVTNPSCKDWIFLAAPDDDDVVVEPNEIYTINVTIDIPIDANGPYWAAVNVSVISRPGTDIEGKSDILEPVIMEIGFPVSSRHFAVYPMIHSLQSRAGESIQTALHLESLLQDGFQWVSIETIDLVPGDDGQWLPIRPDPDRMALLHTSSCRDWICLGDYQGQEISVPPLDVKSMDIEVHVPINKQGRYCAGIRVTLLSNDKKDLYTKYEFIIPVLIEVKETAQTDYKDHTHQSLTMIKCERPLRITQDEFSDDPYHTYSGQYTIEVCSDLMAHIKTSIVALSAAEGIWTAVITPKTIINKQKVDIMVQGTDVMIENLTGGEKRVKVVGLTVTLIPDLSQFIVTTPDES